MALQQCGGLADHRIQTVVVAAHHEPQMPGIAMVLGGQGRITDVIQVPGQGGQVVHEPAHIGAGGQEPGPAGQDRGQ